MMLIQSSKLTMGYNQAGVWIGGDGLVASILAGATSFGWQQQFDCIHSDRVEKSSVTNALCKDYFG